MQKKIYVVGMFDDDTANKVQSAVAGVAGVSGATTVHLYPSFEPSV
jgi:hypothetical protein